MMALSITAERWYAECHLCRLSLILTVTYKHPYVECRYVIYFGLVPYYKSNDNVLD